MKLFLHKSFKRAFCSIVENNIKAPHTPVMLNEVVDYLNPDEHNIILDMTFGAGGHSRYLLKNSPNLKILALDRDPIAHNFAKKLSQEFPGQVVPLLGRFSELPILLKDQNITAQSLDAILMDCGCSSMQFDTADRGFSISKNGPLDMRMDGDRFPDNPTAYDILAKANENDIYKIIKVYGEEKKAKKIARAVVEARYLFKKLTTTQDLADLVDSVCESDYRTDKLNRPAHNATKTFQALRIFVNNELNELNYGLQLAHYYLKIGGRLVTLTFHSLEDTIVKRHIMGNVIESKANPLPLKYSSHLTCDKEFVEEIMNRKWKMLHKHVLVPSVEEVEENPRSRSAKFRASVRVR